MKYLFLLCSVLLLLGIGNLPIGYYTLVRIIVTIGAICALANKPVKNFSYWQMAFAAIAIIFNPIIPVYLHNKAIWIPIDIIAAVLFIIQSLTLKSEKHE